MQGWSPCSSHIKIDDIDVDGSTCLFVFHMPCVLLLFFHMFLFKNSSECGSNCSFFARRLKGPAKGQAGPFLLGKQRSNVCNLHLEGDV